MMTLNSFFEGLSCLAICLTLRRISRRMGWNLRPILQRGGLQLRCRAFPLSKRPRRRSMRSARELSSPMHIFQNFLKTLVLDILWGRECSVVESLRWSFIAEVQYALMQSCRMPLCSGVHISVSCPSEFYLRSSSKYQLFGLIFWFHCDFAHKTVLRCSRWTQHPL